MVFITCALLFTGHAARAATLSQVVIDPSTPRAAIVKDQFGFNEPFFGDVTIPDIKVWWRSIGVGLVRWPGGGGDVYHWRTNSVGPGRCATYGGVDRHSTFDAFMTQLAMPLGVDVVLGVNYGSDATCTGPGDPAEAADWVDYANNVRHYGVKLWTIGNEQWATFSLDLHAPAHSPHTYASNVANRYYPLMKARDPAIAIGIDLAAPYDASWDTVVLKEAKYDFVDIHSYVDAPPRDDEQLLLQGPRQFERALAVTRAELRAAGRASTPIMLGEWNAEAFALGKQQSSIVGALFVGIAGAVMLESGISYAAFYNGFDASCGTDPADQQLYGWLAYGTWSPFSAGAGTYSGAGGCVSGTTVAPYGTIYPPGRALGMLRQFAQPGERMISVALHRAPDTIRAFAATAGDGYTVLLFNLDRNAVANVSVATRSQPGPAFNASLTTYGKLEYDRARSGEWVGPQKHSLGLTSTPGIVVRLAPWSMNVLSLEPSR